MKPVLEYQNYRDYLRDYYLHKKSSNPYFSYRMFARLAQYKSPSFFKEITSGRKRLTPWMAERFGKAMRLSEKETGWLKQLAMGNNNADLN